MMAGILKELQDGRTGAVHQLFKQLTEGGIAGRVLLSRALKLLKVGIL